MEGVHSLALELHKGAVGLKLGPVGDVGHEARRQLNNLVEVLGVEFRLQLGEPVVHLDRALGVAEVEHFVDCSSLLDGSDIGDVIVQTHLGPGPVPVLRLGSIERLMGPTVLGTTVATDPNVVASIRQLEVEWLSLVIVDPGGAIFLVTVLDEDGAGGVSVARLSSLAQHMERGEDVVVVSGDLDGLPIVAPSVHDSGEPWVV